MVHRSLQMQSLKQRTNSIDTRVFNNFHFVTGTFRMFDHQLEISATDVFTHYWVSLNTSLHDWEEF